MRREEIFRDSDTQSDQIISAWYRDAELRRCFSREEERKVYANIDASVARIACRCRRAWHCLFWFWRFADICTVFYLITVLVRREIVQQVLLWVMLFAWMAFIFQRDKLTEAITTRCRIWFVKRELAPYFFELNYQYLFRGLEFELEPPSLDSISFSLVLSKDSLMIGRVVAEKVDEIDREEEEDGERPHWEVPNATALRRPLLRKTSRCSMETFELTAAAA